MAGGGGGGEDVQGGRGVPPLPCGEGLIWRYPNSLALSFLMFRCPFLLRGIGLILGRTCKFACGNRPLWRKITEVEVAPISQVQLPTTTTPSRSINRRKVSGFFLFLTFQNNPSKFAQGVPLDLLIFNAHMLRASFSVQKWVSKKKTTFPATPLKVLPANRSLECIFWGAKVFEDKF